MTILQTSQWKIRDLVMGPGTVFRVADSSKTFALTIRDPQSQDRPHGHGGLVGAEWANPRVIPIRVFIDTVEHTGTSWVDAVDELAAAFQAVGSSGEIVELYRNIDGNEYVWFGRPRLIDPDEELSAGGYGWVQLAFEAADPRRYSAEVSSLATGLPVQQGGLMIPARIASTRLRLPGAVGAYASTPSHASLQITGDTRLRWYGELSSWASGSVQSLVGRYITTTNQRSCRLRVSATGQLQFQWSTDGTATGQSTATSSVVVPVTTGPLAVEAHIDVDNGASQRVVTFRTAPSMAGPWTQLGTNAPTAGVTSIFAGTAALEVGSINSGAAEVATGVTYAAEVQNAGSSTVVANPDFTAQTYGSSSFVDSTGKTWTVHGTAKLVGGTYRNGLKAPFMVPGRLNGGSVTFANVGTAAVPFTARINGPVVEPWILVRQPDGTTQSIRFDLTLTAGQWLTIDTATRQALLNDSPSANQRGRATWLVDPDPILPGVTTIRFGAAEYHPSAQLTVTARSAWW